MQLDWSTVVLEILNFLVLVWLLQRFLYRPIVSVVSARQAAIEQATARTQEAAARAQALEVQYQTRVETWEQERAKARLALQDELQAQRQRMLEALDAELDQQRRKAAVLEQRREQEIALRAQNKAMQQGEAFVRRVLAALAVPQLQAKLIELAVDELTRLPAARLDALRGDAVDARTDIVITSAFPLSLEQRAMLSSALAKALGSERPGVFREDAELVAGVRIDVGAWALHANLSEELSLFSEAARDER